MAWFIGVDVGGTFTDLYAFRPDGGALVVHKTPSTPGDPSRAIARGLAELGSMKGVELAETRRFSHGTTVGTNALLQRKGGKVVLVTTRGFRDLLEIGRQIRPKIYSLQDDQPEHTVDRADRLEIDERILFDGTVHRRIAEQSVEELAAEIADRKPDACAICFLFSFLNSSHEELVAERLRREFPRLHVSTSSAVQREFREYERMSTTVINAYLQPVMHEYLLELKKSLGELIPEAHLGVNQSTGGLMSLDRAMSYPVRTALSGPAAGAIGALKIAETAGYRDIVTLDMGGTSADVCLIKDGRLGRAYEREINGLPIRMPMLDIHTIGAGGGSIAWFDRDELLKVGPASAGATPGPACYGHGGERPTVSDANAVLGRLGARGLLGGSMALDTAAARRVMEPIASRLSITVEEAALGIIQIVESNMVRAIRVVSVEKGYDPRELTLMPFGGAGPLHASGVARLLGIRKILVPLMPGILCAQGLVVSDLKEDFVRTVRASLSPANLRSVRDIAGELRMEAEDWFDAEQVPAASRAAEFEADMRYVGQNYELPVQFAPVDDLAALAAKLTHDFHREHDRQYGFHNETAEISIVNVRLTAIGRLAKPESSPVIGLPHADPPLREERSVHFDRRPVIAGVYDRSDLAPGHRIAGPAIIEQLDATTVLLPGDVAEIDQFLNINVEVPYGF